MTKWALAVIGGAVLLVGIVVGGWQLGWWASEEAVNRRAEINEQSFARQTALQEEVLTRYREVTKIDTQLTYANDEQAKALRAQRKALVVRLCDAEARMTGRVTIPADAQAFVQEECA